MFLARPRRRPYKAKEVEKVDDSQASLGFGLDNSSVLQS